MLCSPQTNPSCMWTTGLSGGFDPYYNQPKIYRQPRYYESTSKKTKGNRVFKTTKVKDEYGNTVYKNTTSHKKKKKKN